MENNSTKNSPSQLKFSFDSNTQEQEDANFLSENNFDLIGSDDAFVVNSKPAKVIPINQKKLNDIYTKILNRTMS